MNSTSFVEQQNNFGPNSPVLLIDDCSDVRAVFEVVSGIQGFPLVTSHDGQDALNKLEAMPDAPFVVFVDLNMPVMNGREFLEKISERGLATKSHIIVFSGAAPGTIELNGKPPEWLQKPFDLSQVMGIISKLRPH